MTVQELLEEQDWWKGEYRVETIRYSKLKAFRMNWKMKAFNELGLKDPTNKSISG